jgi:hypothetical protein
LHSFEFNFLIHAVALAGGITPTLLMRASAGG